MTNRELRPKIVVVDDNSDGRDLTSLILRREGFEVMEAATGAEALALATEDPALMVLDVNLPDIDGFEICRRLKSDPRTANIPILHLSAVYRDSMHRIRGLDEGADAYLTMPVEPGELIATVHALLRVRRAEAIERESESLRAVTRLGSTAAHEINNPLSVITGQLYFLTRELPGSPRVVAMEEAAERIRAIVVQMLHITRLQIISGSTNLPDIYDLDRSSLDRLAS
jgi:two-component system, sensor histidine kinase